ncbi:MAG: UxaA family hydrolase [Emergencia sp.]
MKDILKISPEDNVAVALRDLQAGQNVSDGERTVCLRQDIPRGHKAALCRIPEGDEIIKYGFPIGCASADIQEGDRVHTCNMKTCLSGESEWVYRAEAGQPRISDAGTFQGYLRKDKRVGIRNEIWILPLTGCVSDVAEKLAAENQDLVSGTVDGLYAFTHPFGCSQTGADHERTKRLLASLAKHPNAGAVLILGLGCENLTMEQFREELGEYDPERIRFLVCQDCEDELKEGKTLLKQCAAFAAAFSRQPVPLSSLTVGLKCGGSDGLSGITANPAAGRFSDMLISCGGTAVLTEVPEMFGAEEMLLNRCISREVFDKAVSMINGFRQYFLSHGEKIHENPSPGNKEGGITTLEDKSCGCVQKGGTMPVTDVLEYGEQVQKKGLNLLYGPGNDLVSASALAAAGAQLILFTTGRGTPFGGPVPTVKISSNTSLAERKPGWIDFNAGSVAEGADPERIASLLFELVMEIAGGKKTRSEEAGYRQVAVWKDGVTL